MREQTFLNQYSVTVKVQIQRGYTLSNRERKIDIRNHTSIHANLVISAMNVIFRIPICALDVDQRII